MHTPGWVLFPLLRVLRRGEHFYTGGVGAEISSRPCSCSRKHGPWLFLPG